jgi:uncharacterized protein YcfJ
MNHKILIGALTLALGAAAVQAGNTTAQAKLRDYSEYRDVARVLHVQPLVERVRSTDSQWKERVVAYRVTYEYNGRRDVTRLDHDPGPYFRLADTRRWD